MQAAPVAPAAPPVPPLGNPAPPPGYAAPVNPGQLLPAPATYFGKYTDPAQDTFGGNYVNLYNEFAVGQVQPAPLRQNIYRDGNVGTGMHILAHVRDPAANPDDPGRIVAYHRLTRRNTGMGRQAMPFDGQGLAFFGDIMSGQVPMTVVVPDNVFNQVGPVQVPEVGLITQGFAADPAAESLGPFAAGTADVSPVTTRQAMIVPNKYASLFLADGMKPKAAYLALSGLIHQDNQEIACSPLLDWLRVTLTNRAGQQTLPATCISPLVAPSFVVPTDQQHLVAYRLGIMHMDFPHMQPGLQANSAVMIANGLSALTNEQRLTRQETQQVRADKAAPKTPKVLFGIILDRLMRWAQVPSEGDLPPVYNDLANAKKSDMRIVLEAAIEGALHDMNYVADFPLSPTMSNKITGLKWHSHMTDDFTIGLSIFSVGTLNEESMELQRRMHQHSDAITSSDAAPSLLDVATLQDSVKDVCIPRTFAELRYLVERSQALWHVLLGPHHSVTRQHRLYRDMLIVQEKRLEHIAPRMPEMKFWVPALLARSVQLEVNAWLNAQMRSAYPLQFASLTNVFHEIELQRPWEPQFPTAYYSVSQPAALPFYAAASPTVSMGASMGPSTPYSTAALVLTLPTVVIAPSAAPSVGGGAGTWVAARNNVVVRNMAYNEAIFKKFKDMQIKSRLLKEQIRQRPGVTYPLNSRGTGMCLTFHALGVCNDRCTVHADHYTHTAVEDETLRAWCELHYKLTT
jgi:hypothetical protein